MNCFPHLIYPAASDGQHNTWYSGISQPEALSNYLRVKGSLHFAFHKFQLKIRFLTPHVVSSTEAYCMWRKVSNVHTLIAGAIGTITGDR